MRINKLLFIVVMSISICNSFVYAKSKPNLIFYCGITMVKPIQEIVKIIEKKYDCNIEISQGGSKDLYNSLSYSKMGDLYLPGSNSYREKHLEDGYLLDSVYIGFNKAAIFVQKSNPRNIKKLEDLLNPDLLSILCNPNSGSIGKTTKKLLIKYKGEDFYDDAYDNAIEIGTDSRNLNKALIDKNADLTINWRATAYWNENNKYIDIIKIDDIYAPKKKLVISLLSFSKYPDIAKALMKFASSDEGKDIMKKYGFL